MAVGPASLADVAPATRSTGVTDVLPLLDACRLPVVPSVTPAAENVTESPVANWNRPPACVAQGWAEVHPPEPELVT